MSDLDRTKWNAKYADASNAPSVPSQLVTSLDAWLPTRGKALDLAGGAGRHSIWLAQRGFEVTLADISRAGLALASQRAAEAGVSITTHCLDVEEEAFPVGPWDLILCAYYLRRPLYEVFPKVLAPKGLLVVVQPTVRNLERHDKPPAPYLLHELEIPRLASGLEVLRYEEGWLAENRHQALLIARRATST